MTRIYKYPLQISDEQMISMPRRSIIRFVGPQDGVLCLWAEVPADEDRFVGRTFYIHGTGHTIPQGRRYVGSAVMPPFVWHVYEPPV